MFLSGEGKIGKTISKENPTAKKEKFLFVILQYQFYENLFENFSQMTREH